MQSISLRKNNQTMGFASTYLNERTLFPVIINEAPDKSTGIIVVIPAYNEPGIIKLLDCLLNCSEPDCKVEVIVVVNAPSDASHKSIENNRISLYNIENWKKKNIKCFFRLFSFIADSDHFSGWGVGLARKTGMDEAARRFNFINNPDGIILNLDADCLVDQNYFCAVFNEFKGQKDRSACSIYFEHPLSGIEFTANVYKNIALYELHLRYYFQGLAFAGFPYVFHTVGSAIAVRALSYIKAGGMNRRQAGEDFYFIQKLLPAGGYFNLTSTTVYPSARPSFRVPFGTGASIEKLSEENAQTFLTYDFKAFQDLRCLFDMKENLFYSRQQDLMDSYDILPHSLKCFIKQDEWKIKIEEIRNNTSGLQAFIKRFFNWFNMFKVVKFLNFVHLETFNKRPVEESAEELLRNIGITLDSASITDLLLYYRSMEKNA